MNKKVTAVIVLLVVVLGAWFFMKGKQTKAPAETSKDSTKMEVKSAQEQKTLKELLVQGGSKTCSFSSEENGHKTNGQVYLGMGKMRGDFTAEVDNKAIISHMITDGKESHIWTDGSKAGFKMSMDHMQSGSMDKNNSSDNVDIEKPYMVNCSSWNEDSTKFNLPADVQFMDMASMNMNVSGNSAPENPSMMNGGAASKEAICASLPEPQKSVCLSAITK